MARDSEAAKEQRQQAERAQREQNQQAARAAAAQEQHRQNLQYADELARREYSARWNGAIEDCKRKANVRAFAAGPGSGTMFGTERAQFDMKQCMAEAGYPVW